MPLTMRRVPTGKELGQPEAFIQAKDDLFASDEAIVETTRKFLQDWMDHYVAWTKKHAAGLR